MEYRNRLHEVFSYQQFLLMKNNTLENLRQTFVQDECFSPMTSWVNYEPNQIFSTFSLAKDDPKGVS